MTSDVYIGLAIRSGEAAIIVQSGSCGANGDESKERVIAWGVLEGRARDLHTRNPDMEDAEIDQRIREEAFTWLEKSKETFT